MKAVIDRFEDNYSIVLFGDKEKQVDIPKELLPRNAKEGSWLNVSFEVDAKETQKQEEKIFNLLEKFKRKNQ